MAEIAKIVQGNNFNIAVPLKVYILNEGEVVLEDYTPAEGDDVTIRLVGERRGYTYKPTIEGNVAHLQLSGYEVCGTYAVEVVIISPDGTMLRSYRGDQLAIVYNVDTIIADGAVQDGELYLDSQFFIQGEKGEQGDPGQDGTDGRGIVSITKTATQGLVDTYTITYTDGTTSTFEVTNGQSGGGGEDYIVNVTYSGGTYTADKTPQECCMAFLDGQRVVFANTASTPLYGDSRTFIATSVSVYNQYGQWNIYAISGNGRFDAKVDILCYEKQINTSLTFKTITAQVNADWNASSGVAQILNKPTIPTKTSDLQNDNDFVDSAAMATALATKQDVTAIETMPSGAIAPTDGYEPNKMYDFGKVASVTFAAYNTSKEIANAVNLYMCTFVVASGGTTVTLNANIKYPNGDDGTELTNLLTTEDRVFEITIRDNKLSFLYFD